MTFQQRQSFLDKYRTDQESIEAPTKLASESTLPVIEQDLKIKPRQPKTKAPFYQKMKIKIELPSWKENRTICRFYIWSRYG